MRVFTVVPVPAPGHSAQDCSGTNERLCSDMFRLVPGTKSERGLRNLDYLSTTFGHSKNNSNK